jgi:glutaminyl-tRNA synthetase
MGNALGGHSAAVYAEYLSETCSGSAGQNSVKTRPAIHWLPAHAAVAAEVRLYDRLFTEAQPDASEKNFLQLLNRDSNTVLRSFVEASLTTAAPDDKFQFERNGYFVADRKDHRPEAPAFNLAVSLRDSSLPSRNAAHTPKRTH